METLILNLLKNNGFNSFVISIYDDYSLIASRFNSDNISHLIGIEINKQDNLPINCALIYDINDKSEFKTYNISFGDMVNELMKLMIIIKGEGNVS